MALFPNPFRRLRDSLRAPSAVAATFPAITRPASFAITQAGNAFGDSTTFGVGAPTGQDLVARMRAAVASGPTSQAFNLVGLSGTVTANYYGNGGDSGQNTAKIASNVSYCRTNYAAQMNRIQFFSGGLNDYNTGVTGWARNWPDQVKANFATMAAQVPGGYDYFFDLAPPESNSQAGTNFGADHAYHRRDMLATHGRRANFYARTLRLMRELESPNPANADALAIQLGVIPYSCRGYPTVSGDFADGDPAITSQASAPTIGGAGTDGALIWATATNTMYRCGAGGWQLLDTKHQGRYGNTRYALIRRDMHAASEGTGAPFVPPMEMRCPIDAAAGAVVGQLVYTGTATRFALGNLDGTLNSQFAVSATGQITRTGTGTLTDGVQTLVVAATNANGTLYSALDIYVTRASSVTAPTMRSLSGAISVASRWAHGMTDGTLVSFAVYFQCAAFGTQQTLINLWRQTNLPFQLFVLGNGQLRIVSTNSAGTQSIIASTGVSLGIGTPRWLFGTINTATGAVVMYLGDNPVTMSGTLSTGTLSLGDCNPIFLASSARNQLLEPGSPFVGGTGAGIGFIGLWNADCGWATTANRRVLMDASGNPAARTPYAAVNGAVPRVELWGSKGDWLYGTPDGSNGPQTMSTDWFAVSRMG